MSAKKAVSRDEKEPGMAQRLRQARINAGYKTATLAVNKFNWAASKYRAHENGQNPFKVADAETYGAAFGVSAAWLLTGSGGPPPSPTQDTILYVGKPVITGNNTPRYVRMSGIICAGLWRELALLHDTLSQQTEWIAPIDPRYPTEVQFDMEVNGSAINKIAQAGMYVRCVDMRELKIEIKDGDYIVVERINDEGLQEISAKQYRVNGVIEELHNATDEPLLKDQVIQINPAKNNSKIKIIGKILWAYKKLDQ